MSKPQRQLTYEQQRSLLRYGLILQVIPILRWPLMALCAVPLAFVIGQQVVVPLAGKQTVIDLPASLTIVTGVAVSSLVIGVSIRVSSKGRRRDDKRNRDLSMTLGVRGDAK